MSSCVLLKIHQQIKLSLGSNSALRSDTPLLSLSLMKKSAFKMKVVKKFSNSLASSNLESTKHTKTYLLSPPLTQSRM